MVTFTDATYGKHQTITGSYTPPTEIVPACFTGIGAGLGKNGTSLMLDGTFDAVGNTVDAFLGTAKSPVSVTYQGFYLLAGQPAYVFAPNRAVAGLEAFAVHADPIMADTGGTEASVVPAVSTTPNILTTTGAIPADPASLCFLRGTLIATPDGEMEVERLVTGDMVATRISGETVYQPVLWIGSRSLNVVNNASRNDAFPVRILANALGEQIPRRDILITPEHCILVDGKLIPARMLVNGSSILIDSSITQYEYFHIELEKHSILLAEGLETESFLDTGQRGDFANNVVQSLRPNFSDPAHRAWKSDAAAPLAVDRETIEPIWRRLMQRAGELGLTAVAEAVELHEEPDLRLVTETGLEIRPMLSDGRNYAFVAPGGFSELRLVSRAARPSDTVGPYVDDRRKLGVLVGKIGFRYGRTRRVVDTHLADTPLNGWHAPEADASCRWTNGNAILPLDTALLESRPVFLDIEIIGTGTYPAVAALSGKAA